VIWPYSDNGIVRTLQHPLYLTRVRGNLVHCLDRDGKNRTLTYMAFPSTQNKEI